MSEQLILEGTWEEIAQHADELAGRRVRLIVGAEEVADNKNSVSEAQAKHRMPDPIIETSESGPPFDLPRPANTRRVKARSVPAPLPDPIIRFIPGTDS